MRQNIFLVLRVGSEKYVSGQTVLGTSALTLLVCLFYELSLQLVKLKLVISTLIFMELPNVEPN